MPEAATRGLKRTNADKKKAVLGMLADFPDWADNAIAKHVGVDHKTVAAHRRSILGISQDAASSGDGESSPTKRTVTRGGKTFTMKTDGQKKAGAA